MFYTFFVAGFSLHCCLFAYANPIITKQLRFRLLVDSPSFRSNLLLLLGYYFAGNSLRIVFTWVRMWLPIDAYLTFCFAFFLGPSPRLDCAYACAVPVVRQRWRCRWLPSLELWQLLREAATTTIISIASTNTNKAGITKPSSRSILSSLDGTQNFWMPKRNCVLSGFRLIKARLMLKMHKCGN